MTRSRSFLPRRAFRSSEAALYLSISETKFRQLVAKGTIPQPKRIDGIVTWDIQDLDSFYDSIPREGDISPSDWDNVAL